MRLVLLKTQKVMLHQDKQYDCNSTVEATIIQQEEGIEFAL
jgi:hypothetical protein